MSIPDARAASLPGRLLERLSQTCLRRVSKKDDFFGGMIVSIVPCVLASSPWEKRYPLFASSLPREILLRMRVLPAGILRPVVNMHSKRRSYRPLGFTSMRSCHERSDRMFCRTTDFSPSLVSILNSSARSCSFVIRA